MDRDVTAFRERFNAYKNGKSVSEIYDAGLPKYAGGKDTYENFVDSVIREEGFLTSPRDIGDGKMTVGSGLTAQKWIDQYNKKGNWSASDNRHAVKEELRNTEGWLRSTFPNYDQLPESAKYVLMDIGYNVGPGTLSAKKSPRFVRAVRSGNWQEAMRQMDWGNSDPKFGKGLRDRNSRRQKAWADAFNLSNPVIPVQEITPYIAKPVSTAIRPIIKEEQTIPAYDPTISPYVSGKPMLKLRPRVQLPNLIEVMEDSEWEPPFQLILPGYNNGKLPGYKDGKIYIKPANRGKFTALKKRTGHSASWFKENGTPEQKKMAVFALNAKKWKH